MGSFGVGLSRHPDAAEAVGEAIGAVLEQVGRSPTVAALWVTGHHRAEIPEIVDTVAALLDPGHLVGATAIAVVGGASEVEDGPGLSLWAGHLPDLATPVRLTATVRDGAWDIDGMPLPVDATQSGRRTLVVLADPATFPADGFLGELSSGWPGVTALGGMASAAASPGANRLVLDGEVHTHGAVGLLFETPIETVVSQGCRPIGRPYVVTGSEGNVITQLGGKPAIERVVDALEALTPAERQLAAGGLHVGRVVDESKADFERGDFLVRAVLGADRASGTLTVGDVVPVGATVQLQVRDAVTADEDLAAALQGRDARSALLFTCNGRGRRFFDEPDHDASAVSQALATTAVAGMFCAGEIGPVGTRSFVHGYTASLALFP
jgi:small ligand-binding sensory domain FIST